MAMAVSAMAHAQDVFIGMVTEDSSGLYLERCTAGKPRYRLRAAEGADDPLAKVQGRTGLVQAEIFGIYHAEGDGHALDVIGVGDVKPGRTCQLVEAVEAYFSGTPEPAPVQEGEGNSAKALAAAAPAVADTGKPDAALAGHYYLSGVMETGSELLLKANGRFEWYISYGAVDQTAKGRWGRTGQTVILAADLPSPDAPLFRADAVLPWDEDAERQLRENRRMQQVEMATARCPWNVAATTTLWSYDLENLKPATDAARAKADAARRVAEAARDEASRITARAAASSATDDDRAAADTAMNAWYSAQSDMAQAYHDANLPEPDIGAPAVPAECQVPDDTGYKPVPESEWHRGVGVVVGDPARELRLSRVEVTFVFGDGHRETTKTRRGGFAFAPVRNGTAVEQIVLGLPEPVSRSATLAIKPLATGIQAIVVDTQQIVAPAFSVMRLDVKGKNLIPQDMPRGRYSRN